AGLEPLLAVGVGGEDEPAGGGDPAAGGRGRGGPGARGGRHQAPPPGRLSVWSRPRSIATATACGAPATPSARRRVRRWPLAVSAGRPRRRLVAWTDSPDTNAPSARCSRWGWARCGGRPSGAGTG